MPLIEKALFEYLHSYLVSVINSIMSSDPFSAVVYPAQKVYTAVCLLYKRGDEQRHWIYPVGDSIKEFQRAEIWLALGIRLQPLSQCFSIHINRLPTSDSLSLRFKLIHVGPDCPRGPSALGIVLFHCCNANTDLIIRGISFRIWYRVFNRRGGQKLNDIISYHLEEILYRKPAWPATLETGTFYVSVAAWNLWHELHPHVCVLKYGRWWS